MAIFEDTDQPLTAGDIDDVEIKLGITIPGDLRDHYLRWNGGRPNPRFFLKEDQWYGVHYFLAMNTGDPNIGFEETYQDLALDTPEFPKGFIPIAYDEGGDYFLYSLRDRDYGKIFFNQSDYHEDEERFLVALSETLASFLGSLAEPD